MPIDVAHQVFFFFRGEWGTIKYHGENTGITWGHGKSSNVNLQLSDFFLVREFWAIFDRGIINNPQRNSSTFWVSRGSPTDFIE